MSYDTYSPSVASRLLSVFDDIQTEQAPINVHTFYLIDAYKAYNAERNSNCYSEKISQIEHCIKVNYELLSNDDIFLRASILCVLPDDDFLKNEAELLVRRFLSEQFEVRSYTEAECQLTVIQLMQRIGFAEDYVEQQFNLWIGQLEADGSWRTQQKECGYNGSSILHPNLALMRLQLLGSKAPEVAKMYYRSHISSSAFACSTTAELLLSVFPDDCELKRQIADKIFQQVDVTLDSDLFFDTISYEEASVLFRCLQAEE